MALSENSVPSKACCIRGYDSRYVSEVCFGGMFRGMFRPPLLKSWVWFVVWFAGMIRGHDSGYDSRKCNMHVIINFVYIYIYIRHFWKHSYECSIPGKIFDYPKRNSKISLSKLPILRYLTWTRCTMRSVAEWTGKLSVKLSQVVEAQKVEIMSPIGCTENK